MAAHIKDGKTVKGVNYICYLYIKISFWELTMFLKAKFKNKTHHSALSQSLIGIFAWNNKSWVLLLFLVLDDYYYPVDSIQIPEEFLIIKVLLYFSYIILQYLLLSLLCDSNKSVMNNSVILKKGVCILI